MDRIKSAYRPALYGILAIAGLLYIALISQYQTGIYNDDAVYVIVANDLNNQAASRMLPTIRRDYPLPGVPMLLAPVATLLRPHWRRLDWMSIVITLLTVWLLGFWARVWLPPREALTITALYAFNPTTVKFSGIVMPACYYAFAVVAGFLLLHRVLRKRSLRYGVALGALIGWAALVRPEGVVLLAAIVLSLAGAQLSKRSLLGIAAPVLAWGAFLAYWFHGRHLNRFDYAGDLGALFRYWTHHGHAGGQAIVKFSHLLFENMLLAVKFGDTPLMAATANTFIVCALALTVAGFWRLWTRRPGTRVQLLSMALFAAFYAGIHLFWHVALPRYALPMLPIVFILIAGGWRTLARRPPPFAWLAVPILLSYAWGNGRALWETYRAPNPVNAPPWHALDWIRHHTPSTVKIMSPFAPSIVLYANHPVVPVLKSPDVEAFVYTLTTKHIGYIADRPMTFVTPGVGKTENQNNEWARVRRWVTAYPRWFHLEFRDAAEQVSVYRVLADERLGALFQRYFSAVLDYRDGRVEQAFVKARDCVTNDPDFGDAYDLLGALYYARHDYTAAESAFKRAAELLPDNPVPRLNLATLYHSQGQRALAMQLLQDSLNLITDNGEGARYLPNLKRLTASWAQHREIMFY